MAKKMMTDADINMYRSAALISVAYPQLNGGQGPIYWDQKMSKGVNAYGLREVIILDPKEICKYFKRELPESFIDNAERYFREELGFPILDFSFEEIIEEVSGQKFFMSVAAPFVRDTVLKSERRRVERCIPQEAVDKYGVQMAETLLNNNPDYAGRNHKVVNFSITDSKRFAEIHFAEIPLKDVDGRKVPCQATGFVQFGMSDKTPLSGDKEEFMSNVIDVINCNLNAYKDSLCPTVANKFRSEVSYGAGVLGKKL